MVGLDVITMFNLGLSNFDEQSILGLFVPFVSLSYMLLPSYSKAVLGPKQYGVGMGRCGFFEREQIIFHLKLGSHISIHQDRDKIWGNIRPHMEGFNSSHSKLGQIMRHLVTVPGTKHEFRENKRGMA